LIIGFLGKKELVDQLATHKELWDEVSMAKLLSANEMFKLLSEIFNS
jgi:hypothetical protein